MPQPATEHFPRFEFHVSRKARDRYRFAQTLFALNGHVVIANFRAARAFAQTMNARRDLLRFPERAVKAGQINAMGLIEEILHYVVRQYRTERNPRAMTEALAWVTETVGAPAVETTLRRFAEEFPPTAVYRRELALDAYLDGETAGVPHRELLLEELLLLWLANANPATAPFAELFDSAELAHETAYVSVIAGLRDFFATQPPFGPDHQPLVEMLATPARMVPHSLAGQLAYMLEHWGLLIGDAFRFRLLGSLDLISEEDRPIFGGDGGSGPAHVYDYTGLDAEPERFSPDREWMPRLVLMAKNAYVWLDQLAKKYGRPLTRLDDIPDAELDALARQGFSGLWLIGLWERSRASERIKHLCGNHDAVASAYSLETYDPADDLGGATALHNLRDRAWQRGIRLSCDMVPNHVGIDSRWVIEHPDWFVGLPESPFPSYSFTGPNLSSDERVGIYLEDHYYSRDDAAVVFKRVDFHTGSVRYLYHGNDGTNMAWNDTAQLNYLLPEVREAVIRTIIHVARQFPIIRFDAAMTLAKKHYQRLWFPEPGTGGAIPSRAEHGLTRAQFEAAFPQEFWREVVDRIAQEVPDTLLLAEAFWLMEGYFVRTLGMHRVYNSAFMVMLRDEDNAKYRSVMKNTLEFDPEVLKRFVNFMNNPDERTAIDQFGDGDKYFGVCVLLATLPGLPMFGHGQLEGLAEKYGMEFRRAYWEEEPKPWLLERHEQVVFPLLRRRHVFAEVREFLLYDFFTPEGYVCEDVYAYSNRAGDDRGVVIYHNAYASTHGWVHRSAGYLVKDQTGGRTLCQRTLGEGLGLHADAHCYTIFRDSVTGLEYLRSSKELCEKGLYLELHAYQHHVFMDFREVCDSAWHPYAHLAAFLNGRGVPSIEEGMRQLLLQPVHGAFAELVNAETFRRLQAATPEAGLHAEVGEKTRRLLQEIKRFTGAEGTEVPIVQETLVQLTAWDCLPAWCGQEPVAALLDHLTTDAAGVDSARQVVLGWLFVHDLGRVVDPEEPAQQSRSWLDEWLLGKLLAGTLQELGQDDATAWRGVAEIALLVTHQEWSLSPPESLTVCQVVTAWFQDPEMQRLLRVNRHRSVLWFSKEALEHWLLVALLQALTVIVTAHGQTSAATVTEVARIVELLAAIRQAADTAGYQVEKLLDIIEEPVAS